MGWLARSLGQAGADLGQAYDINQTWQQRAQQMKIEAARQKMAELMLPLQLQELKNRIAQFGQPTPEGIINLPGGGTAGATFTPGKGYSTQPLTPGMDRNTVKQRISQMASTAPKEYQSAIQDIADSIDLGEDPAKAYEKAQQLVGQAAGKAASAGRLVKGDIVPSKDSVTGYARQMLDQQGNLVRSIQNVVVPGLTPREVQGWAITQDSETGEIIMVPKTTVTRPASPGARPSAGGTPQAGGVPGSVVIGRKDTAEQRDAIKASQQARDAFTNYSEGLRNSQTNNPRTNIALVIAAAKSTIAGGGGRLNSAEIEQQLKAGGFPDKVQRWYQMATSGTLPDDQRQQIIDLLKNDYDAKRVSATQAWQYAYPDRPLPPWLQGPIGSSGGGSATLPPGFVLDKK